MIKQSIFVEQLKQLVSCRTLSGDIKENSRALDLVESWLDKRLDKKRLKNGKAEIFIAGNSKSMSPNIAYMVHMDVVSGKPEQFSVKIEGDRLVGRGVSDMKFSIPIGIALLNKLLLEKSKLSFSLVITTDEEVGGFDGAKYLSENLQFRPKALIIPDGGDNFELVNRSKGVAHIWIESMGKTAHASTIWEGKNALHPLMKLASQLLAIYEINEHEKNWGTTLNVGVVNGGVSTNQVCPYAVMKLDFRFPESESVKGILSKVIAAAKIIDPGLMVSLAASGDPTFTDPENKYVRRMLEVGRKVIGREIPVVGEEGASDGRYFAKFDIPIILIKPDGGDIHGDNEWINIPSVMKFYEMLEVYLKGV